MYVVINMKSGRARGAYDAMRYYVLGFEASTCPSMEEALSIAAEAAVEFDHDLSTARIFELVEVKITPKMEAQFEAAVDEIQAEMEV